MKMLIIGVNGLLGFYLARQAEEEGWIVNGISRNKAKYRFPIFRCANGQGIIKIIDATRPAVIVFCAAWTHVDACELEPEKCLEVNSLLPSVVARAAHQRKIKFVFVSSSYIFNGKKKNPYREEDKPDPLNWYGESKKIGEKLVMMHTEDRALIIRTVGLYGLVSGGKDFLQQVVRAVSQGQSLAVARDQFGNFTFAGDLAKALCKLLAHNMAGVWNIAGPNPRLSRNEIAKEICRLGGWDSSLIRARSSRQLAQAASRPKNAGLSISKIRNLEIKMRSLEEVYPQHESC